MSRTGKEIKAMTIGTRRDTAIARKLAMVLWWNATIIIAQGSGYISIALI
jgi:hypothetical protein